MVDDPRYPFDDLLKAKPGAVANAKKMFSVSTDRELKQRIASILLGVGVKDGPYFQYLTDAAKKALNDPRPWPDLYDENGRRNSNPKHPAFVAWCKKRNMHPNEEETRVLAAANPDFLDWCMDHNVPPSEARHDVIYEIPIPWYFLASAHDPRAYDLLIQGLHSHNVMIVSWAAQGLARLQDPRAVDELIAAGRRMPSDTPAGIAIALLYFPEPRAQAAAKELFLALTTDPAKNQKMWELYRKQAQEKGPKGLFEW